MMTSERLPIAWIWATTRYGRRSAAGQARSSSTKKVAWWPRIAQHLERAPAEPRDQAGHRRGAADGARLKRAPRNLPRAAAPDSGSGTGPSGSPRMNWRTSGSSDSASCFGVPSATTLPCDDIR